MSTYRSLPLLSAAAAMMGLGLVVPCRVSAIDVPTSDDAYVWSANPTWNYGGAPNMRAETARWAYVKYDVVTSLPVGITAAEIKQAWLHIYVNTVNTAGSIDVCTATSSWSEGKANGAGSAGNIVWNNKPGASAAVATFSVTSTTEKEFVSIDVTDEVKAWITTPASNFGFVFKGGTGDITFDTKENDATSNRSTLDITLTGPTGPSGKTWYTGTTAPSGGTGVDGDFYLNTATNQYYVKSAGVWGTPTTIMGQNGKTWFQGTTAPTVGVADGDMFLNTQTHAYQVRSGGAWGAATSLIGPAVTRIQPKGNLSMGTFTANAGLGLPPQ